MPSAPPPLRPPHTAPRRPGRPHARRLPRACRTSLLPRQTLRDPRGRQIAARGRGAADCVPARGRAALPPRQPRDTPRHEAAERAARRLVAGHALRLWLCARHVAGMWPRPPARHPLRRHAPTSPGPRPLHASPHPPPPPPALSASRSTRRCSPRSRGRRCTCRPSWCRSSRTTTAPTSGPSASSSSSCSVGNRPSTPTTSTLSSRSSCSRCASSPPALPCISLQLP